MDSKNHIVLVGLPGVGKTSVGKSLSKMSDGIHVDIDQEIQKDQEISISDLINQKGEDAFRVLEEDKLKVILDSPSSLIVSSGGGVVLSDKNRKLIKEKSFSIYITCSIDQIAKRLDVLNRPLLYDTNKNIQLEKCDITDQKNFEKILLKYNPEEIYNLAAQSSVGKSFKNPKETFKSINSS